MICPFCKEEIKDEALVCKHCGRDLPQKGGTIGDEKTLLDRIGRYTDLKEIGKGGMGIVYRAHDTVLKETVALKELPSNLADDKKAFERFIEEARSTRHLTHSNIVRIYDVVEQSGRYYISMEYIDGKDLKQLIRGKGRFSIEEVVQIARQLCSALGYAHSQGVIHRDLKPGNILLTGKGNVKVADFGIAKALDRTGFTTTGQILGTPEYMSPEQAEGKEIDTRTDIYSLGIVLYEMLTGKVPLEADSTPAVLYKQVHEIPKPLRTHIPDIPSEIERVVLKCLEKDRSKRYQGAIEVSGALKAECGIDKITKPKVSFKHEKLTNVLVAVGIVILVCTATIISLKYGFKGEEKRITIAQKGRQEKLAKIDAEKQKAKEEAERKSAEVKKLLIQVKASYDSKEYQQAIVEANKVLVIDPDNIDAKRYISLAQAGLKEIEDVKAQKERHNDYQRWYDKGIEETIDKNYDGAITAFQRALEYEETKEARDKLNEANYEKYHNQGEKAEKEGDLDKAIGLYQKSLEYKKAQETENKIVSLKSRIEEEKKQKEAKERFNTWYNKGEQYEKKGEWKKAKKAYEEALASVPGDIKAKERIAYCEDKLNPTPQEITNSIGMKFILIKAGEFLMGSPNDERGRNRDETQHKVILTKDFYLHTTEITQAQYEEVMGTNPSHWKGRDLPVEEVSWNDAVEFCKKLSQKEGREYRLPTEAEWEYACRAGTTTMFYFGDDEKRLGEYVWYNKNSSIRIHPVGQKKPNAWGLYDMHGNVYEWCSDWYSYYQVGDGEDPEGPDSGDRKVLRGGSWMDNFSGLRCANRFSRTPNLRGWDITEGIIIGFRCARTP